MIQSIHRTARALLALLCAFTWHAATAQELLLDQMQEAGGLKLFPVYGDTKTFYYLPDRVVIPNGPDGKKQFSFLKFVNDEDASGEGGIQDLDGGGLVSFLIQFSIDDQTLRNAQAQLQSKVSGARIAGPVTYREGTFALVSNFQQENGDWTQRVLGLGKSPVMEDHKAAVSIRLTKTGAILLWESFAQAASDISVSFDMTIGGYRNPYEAKMTAWWDRVAKNRSLNAALRTDYLGVDIQDIMKELRQQGAIELEVKGEDDKMDRLWEMAYGKLAEQMFEQNNDPVTLATLQDDPDVFSNFERANQFNTEVRERINDENRAEIEREMQEREMLLAYADRWALLGVFGEQSPAGQPPGGDGQSTASTDSGKRPVVRPAEIKTPPSFSLLASYRKKQFKTSGKFELNFKKWTADTQSMRFDENIGGFGKRMFNDPAHFRKVVLTDPAYTQREILVQLDGQDADDFAQFVNSVVVSIRKTHQDGFEHRDELTIRRDNFNDNNNLFVLTYPNRNDTDIARWVQYEYKVTWNLFGGAKWTSDWQRTEEFVIPLTPPHRYREITVEADPDVFADAGVRLATVKFKYHLFEHNGTEEVTLKPGNGGVLSQVIKYAHAPDDYGYEYDISWLQRGGTQLEKTAQSGDQAFIFADELPQ